MTLCCLNVLNVIALVCWMNLYRGAPKKLKLMTMTAPAHSSAEESIESESTLHSGTRPKDWDDWDSMLVSP